MAGRIEGLEIDYDLYDYHPVAAHPAPARAQTRHFLAYLDLGKRGSDRHQPYSLTVTIPRGNRPGRLRRGRINVVR